jgi:hypothetical protein
MATERTAEHHGETVQNQQPQAAVCGELSLSVLVVEDDPLVLGNPASMLEDVAARPRPSTALKPRWARRSPMPAPANLYSEIVCRFSKRALDP